MKIIGSFIGLLLFSLSAFTAVYSGAGVWKSNDGESGNYNAEATIEQGSDNTVAINQTITFDNEAMNIKFVLQKIDDNFYNVLNDQNEPVGSGYCWTLDAEGEFLCHTVSHENNHVVESTIKKTADTIYRIGSITNNETGKKTIWKDALLLQDNE